MDEISYKLKSGNSLLVVSAVEKLLYGVRTDGGSESDALRVLRESCASAEPAVALAACQGLLSLAENGVLSPAHTMSTMLAMLPTAKNYTAIISTISGLLTLDLRTPTAGYACRFSLKSPQHPLVTVLENCTEAGDHVLGQMQAVCCHPHLTISENSLELLRAVFLWFICHPTEEQSLRRRAACWSLLLSLPQKQQERLMRECLLWQQVSNTKHSEVAFSLYSALADMSVHQKNTEYILALTPAIARISNQFITLGKDPRPCYSCIDRCFGDCPAELQPIVGITLALLAENGLRSPALYLHSLYALCHKLVTKYDVPSISLSILVAYSLQWLKNPSYLTAEALKVIAELVQVHQRRKNFDNSLHTYSLRSNKLVQDLLHADRRLFVVFECFQTWERLRNDKTQIEDWLNKVKETPHINLKEELVPFLIGILMENKMEAEIAVMALQIALEVVKNDNDLAVLVLPILLYKVSRNSSSKIQLECLKAMPFMARFKPNVHSVVAIFNMLKSSHGVPPSLLIHLFSDLVEVQSRCYPYLQELLLDSGGEKTEVELKWETEIGRAKAVKSICETRASIYGAELVSVISGLLNRCKEPSGTIASSLALDSLRLLWLERIVSPASTWYALATKLAKDKRPGVHVSLCKLLLEVPGLRTQSPEYDKFIRDTARALWAYISNSNHPEVIVAACEALANYKIDDYTLKDVPEVYRQGLKLPASYCKTPADAARRPEDVLDYIPAEVWPNVFKNTNLDGLAGVQTLVSTYMEREIRAYRSGVYQVESRVGKMEPDSLVYLPPHSVVRGVMEFVRKQAISPAYDCPDTVLLRMLACLTHTHPRALPPLDMNFVHELFHRGAHFHQPSLVLAARQALSSVSAKRFVETYLSGVEPADGKEEEINSLFDMLASFCQTVPPAVLRTVLQKCMSFAYGKVENENKLKEEETKELMFVKQLNKITECLLSDQIHEANRTLLSQLVEGYWELMTPDNVAWSAYEIACCALSTKYLERMTSPSSWWETTWELLRKSAPVRARLASSHDLDTPLVWLNEMIAAAVSMPSEHMYLLQTIAAPLSTAPPDENSKDWLLQLMARVQTTIADSPEDTSGLVFLCDVFTLSVVLLSGYQQLQLEGDAVSRGVRCQLFPSAVAAILAKDKWKECSVQMIEWLHHTRTVPNLPKEFRSAFYRALVACRYAPHFSKHSTWTRVLSVPPPSDIKQ